jgi:hypothetical protein
MKILQKGMGYAHHLYKVALGPEDTNRTDADLITEADNQSGYQDMTVRHFGGMVNRLPDGTAMVKVYID